MNVVRTSRLRELNRRVMVIILTQISLILIERFDFSRFLLYDSSYFIIITK